MFRKWKKRLNDYKEELLKAVVLTVPLALVAKVNEQISGRLFGQPWQAMWFLVPIADRRRASCGIARCGSTPCAPIGRMLLFLGAYILFFTVASQSSVLDVSRELTAFGAPASRRSITPGVVGGLAISTGAAQARSRPADRRAPEARQRPRRGRSQKGSRGPRSRWPLSGRPRALRSTSTSRSRHRSILCSARR